MYRIKSGVINFFSKENYSAICWYYSQKSRVLCETSFLYMNDLTSTSTTSINLVLRFENKEIRGSNKNKNAQRKDRANDCESFSLRETKLWHVGLELTHGHFSPRTAIKFFMEKNVKRFCKRPKRYSKNIQTA